MNIRWSQACHLSASLWVSFCLVSAFSETAFAAGESSTKNNAADKTEAPHKIADKDSKKKSKTADKKQETPTATPKENKRMSNGVQVTMTTSMGVIKLELDSQKAPITTQNFVDYAKSGHYDKTIFHRVIDGFMIQGGGMDEKMKEKKTNAPIKNEATNGLKNDRGTIAMARTNDPNSATSQFFINLVNNDFLNPSPGNAGYAVFGHVTEGMDVVDKIAKVKTGQSGMHGDVPVKPVVIESVKVEK